VALVIGNSNYAHATRLANPVNDADAISQVLAQAHFTVTREHNLGYEALRNALKQFSSTARNSDVALVYFAGHGLEMDGENYLVPIDAVLAHDGDVKYEAVPLDLVRDTVSGARTLRLVFVDACRDNPFLDRMEFAAGSRRSIGERGLARIDETRPGEVVFFAAKERTTAADGEGGHSPFASALIRDIPQPLELNLLIRTVSDDVATATNNAQLPYAYQSLTKQQFYFVPPTGGGSTVSPAPVAAPVPLDPKAIEKDIWDSVKDTSDTAQLQSYIDQYPKGSFAGIARAKIKSLQQASAASPPGNQQVALAQHAPPPASGGSSGAIFRDCRLICPEMVTIPPGSFVMGSPSDEIGRGKDEGPQHTVNIGYRLAVGKYDVTRDEYAAFVQATNRADPDTCYSESTQGSGSFADIPGHSWHSPGFSQTGRDPVVCVSWDDAAAYAAWLSQKTGSPYRLLSESEWEYAARGGTTTAFYWGESAQDQCHYANGADQALKGIYGTKKAWISADCSDSQVYTSPAGTFAPNVFGLFDMAGNAWQWTEDCYADNYNGAPLDGSVSSRGNCLLHVVHGGSWSAAPQDLRSANRNGILTSHRNSHIGFRVARTF